MTVLITLTTAGLDVGPFDLYSNIDGYVTAFETGVSKSALEAGYTSTLVPDFTATVRVKSTGACVNYIDILVTGITTTTSSTTTTTTTISPYSITSSCVGSNITNDYTLVGVPTDATVVVRATFSGYLTRASGSTYPANASVGVNGSSQTSPCISSQGGVNVQYTDTFSAPSNGVFSVSAVATNYSSAAGMNLNIELVSVNGQAVGDTITGCWGNSGGANGCPAG